ncbi:tRNA adenosine(34) deaminase TadA [Ponticaulis koreensis]|uniref:tRNA adenosine(34) deaminase TadA n=1 Tax=Ponticaulis koreensis TaxID=1123045 RepID=UPI00040F09F8|nr:tRNA adenosine(34) deaminase TadA [Ponticaulis koreensis]
MSDKSTYMRRALELAEEAAAAGEVPVGAVLVDPETGDIIAEGRNGPIERHDATAHAEIVAIRAASIILENYRLMGLHLYTTLEPCTMCAGAIANARIERIIFAAEDVKGGAVTNGIKFFEQPTCHWHPEVEQGPFAEESSALLQSFFRARRKSGKPQITGDNNQSE